MEKNHQTIPFSRISPKSHDDISQYFDSFLYFREWTQLKKKCDCDRSKRLKCVLDCIDEPNLPFCLSAILGFDP